jgi:hypothetical protein
MGTYYATPTPDMGDPATPDVLLIGFYGSGFDPSLNGEQKGTFDLSMGGDNNLATCSRCLVVLQDNATQGKTFMAQSGTLIVQMDSDQLHGSVNATVTNVDLVEVTIDPNTNTSTPVPGGECRHVASAAVAVTNANPGWTCNASYYNDGDCDCGCGIVDPDCADATAASCDFCDDIGSCNSSSCPGTINPTNNATCVSLAAWTCDPGYYNDGVCDCGCGMIDADCADATVASCDYCDDEGSCNTASCPGKINPTNNSVCTP